MVSVIIPVYNGERCIERCLKSVVEQSYRDLEIIIIDDGSTDGTYKVCERFVEKDNRIRLIHQKNKGVSAARNAGLDAARGEYITFVDSDDILLPDAFDENFEDADLIVYDYIFVKGGRYIRKKGINTENSTSQSLIWYVLCGGMGFSVAKLYRRMFLKKNAVSFEEKCIQCEDADFILELVKKRPSVHYIARPVYQYNYSTSTSMGRWRNKPTEMIFSGDYRFQKNMEYLSVEFPDDYEIRKEKLQKNRIHAIYGNAIDLCCVNMATKDNRKTVERMMGNILPPRDLDKSSRRRYLLVIRKHWFLIWVIAKLRMCYLYVMRF